MIELEKEVPEGVLMKVRSCPCPFSIQVAFLLLSGCHEGNSFASNAPTMILCFTTKLLMGPHDMD